MIDTARRALAHYEAWREAEVAPFGNGLINATFAVSGPSGRAVLQRLNAIFDPAIHHNIAAVTQALDAAGLVTPRLLPTSSGAAWVDLEDGGVWRMLSWVDGVSVDVVVDDAQAHAAGALVGRFHRALEGLEHDFVGLRRGVHDTPAHLAGMRDALATHPNHRLFAQASALAAQIDEAVTDLPPLSLSPQVVGHGDLKISNLLFRGHDGDGAHESVCLVDLDTLGPIALAHELGDAWRSWCNRSREDDAGGAAFDLGIFRASWEGYRDAAARPLDDALRRELLHGVEWIVLELCARFTRDVLEERYFGWDATVFESAGDHNLARARGQWSLFEAARACRDARSTLLAG